LRLDDYDFILPEHLIAQAPIRPRDSARMLVVRPAGLEDRGVRDLPALLGPGDVIVVNDTRVIPARLHARRGQARVEIMLNRHEEAGIWHALIRNARRLKAGDEIVIEGAYDCTARVLDDPEGGAARLDFGPDQARLAAALEKAGEVPLPPYISRPEGPTSEDTSDYQTIFARRPGAVAAPTASLHKLHEEWGEITPEAAAQLNAARTAGGRIIAIGTTALRLLESAVLPDGSIIPFRGLTDLSLLPGHTFRSADALMTNFHLPRSTLFMLVCAFAGDQCMRAAYAHAIAQSYRFYSYGDSSLLFRASDAP